jgi:hypothetical protein
MTEARGFLLLLGAAGGVIFAQQFIEMLPALQQTDYGEAAGRYQLLARAGGRAPAVAGAHVLIIGAALSLGHPRAVRLLGSLHLGLGVVLLALLPVLLLDAGTLAGEASGAPTSGLRVQAGRIAALLLGGGVLAIVAGRHLKHWRGAPSMVTSRSGPAEEPLPG